MDLMNFSISFYEEKKILAFANLNGTFAEHKQEADSSEVLCLVCLKMCHQSQ